MNGKGDRYRPVDRQKWDLAWAVLDDANVDTGLTKQESVDTEHLSVGLEPENGLCPPVE